LCRIEDFQRPFFIEKSISTFWVHEQKTNYLTVQRKKVGLNDIDIDSQYLEQVKSYNYLGSIVNGDNSIEEEIKERIALSSKDYYANQNIFKSKLLTKKTKLELYWIVICL